MNGEENAARSRCTMAVVAPCTVLERASWLEDAWRYVSGCLFGPPFDLVVGLLSKSLHPTPPHPTHGLVPVLAASVIVPMHVLGASGKR